MELKKPEVIGGGGGPLASSEPGKKKKKNKKKKKAAVLAPLSLFQSQQTSQTPPEKDDKEDPDDLELKDVWIPDAIPIKAYYGLEGVQLTQGQKKKRAKTNRNVVDEKERKFHTDQL